MDGLTACASFPSDLGQNEAIDTDTSEAVSERRSELFTLLKNCAKVAAEHVYAFVRGRLQAAFNSTNASWQVSGWMKPVCSSREGVLKRPPGRVWDDARGI